ncbi:MAG: formyltransferase family protein [Phycisphaerales bacterium JB054]
MTDTTTDKLRVLLITEDDPLYVVKFFEVFFAEWPRDRIELVGITISEAFHEPIWKTAKRMLSFYGPIDFVRLCFRFAMVKLRGYNIGKLAREAGVPLVETASVNDEAYVAKVRDEIRPDVIVSVAAPEIFKKGILGAAKERCINIHCGRLPIYRGMMPNFWQLLHGEQAATLTVHEMVEKLDAGGIVQIREFPLRERDSLDRVIVGTKQESARLMLEVLERFASGEVVATPLDMTDKKYFSFPKPKDVKQFRKRGHRML